MWAQTYNVPDAIQLNKLCLPDICGRWQVMRPQWKKKKTMKWQTKFHDQKLYNQKRKYVSYHIRITNNKWTGYRQRKYEVFRLMIRFLLKMSKNVHRMAVVICFIP